MTNEHKIEMDFINKLIDLKYSYRSDIRNNHTLEQNFREKFQELNQVNLSDNEFSRLLESIIDSDVYTASKTLREKNSFEREDGTPLFYTLVNTKEWCKNSFEVINQLRMNTDSSHHRYDVILLINGIPMVQIELKTLGVSPRRAMAQIVEYKNDLGNGYTKTLLCFMQLFIVSNQNDTWYFANNNNTHFNFDADERFLPYYRYADQSNKKITNLDKFTKSFLKKCILGDMLSKYMVLVAVEQKLLVMRPYQIYAVEAIVQSIHQNRGNGYIWHTTGSGKTLTSFKASTLLKDNPDIEKCLFVVDRKDLDKQTREEFNKFQEGCVEENTNTGQLVERLLSTNYANKVIVTTIQKLGLALDDTIKEKGKDKKNKKNYKEQLEPLRNKRVVFIFDECHRSQFGKNHEAIKEFFPNSQLFGFTGTPIFEDNATYRQIDGQEATMKTTEDIFQKELYAYTITHAIDDKNVLSFHIDYFKAEEESKTPIGTIKQKAVVEAILDKHNTATSNGKFNAILASASINEAIEYYRLFKQIQKERKEEIPNYYSLNIACVFSPPAEGNKEIKQIQEDLEQEKEDNKENSNEKKKVLKEIIADYNKQYSTNHNINNFDLYYQDIQKRIKDQKYPNKDYAHKNKIDITIVVDMLLTGFDSKFLNTLYVDKNLKYHGLIQAFSRTNRVLNDTKPYGNILDFRGQQDQVDKAITLFSGEQDKEAAKTIWLVDSAPIVIEKYEVAVKAVEKFMHSQGLENTPEDVINLKGDNARGEFINLFKDVQRLKTQLDQYTDISQENEEKIKNIMPIDTLRGFRGVYIETAKKLKAMQDKGDDNIDEIVEQLDFEFVLFASAVIDYDYIMGLIAKYTTQTKTTKYTMTKEQIISLIDADAKFIDEREDIKAYIDTLEMGSGLSEEQIKQGYEEFKVKKSATALDNIASKYSIDSKALNEFMDITISRMILDADMLSELFTPQELGWKERGKKELELMEELIPLLKRKVGDNEISGLSAYE
ncbi:MAG: type I restriction endonuclease subunit R [Arcobacter sp.]|jgi:type I restriction enzyme R subunit|uniref:type I restriction endonuclease subunit R n=1 Tax=Arcobacter sp. TaxID=1872629 RepID=UPI002A75F3BB|nr:type I restriction endonuclease subunit R [Arcobacter sp.]MDY3199658.1 type I restriction endonuclease subunit R [Arcobacter sp.]